MRRAPLLALALLAPLGGCDTVDVGATPADVNACRPSKTFFLDQVWPNFLAKDYGGKHCSDGKCHDASSGRQLVLPVPTSAPAVPFPPDWELVYKSATEQMRCTNVRSSPLLAKPALLQTHGGDKLIEPDGPEATLLEMWVTTP